MHSQTQAIQRGIAPHSSVSLAARPSIPGASKEKM